MATVYASDGDGGGRIDERLEDVLLRNYHTIEVLNFPIDYAMDLYLTCLRKEREDRLYLLWVSYFTNAFGAKERKSWEEFKELSTASSPTPSKKVGTLTGVDLAQLRK